MQNMIFVAILFILFSTIAVVGGKAWDKEQHNYDLKMLNWAQAECNMGNNDACQLENHFYTNGLYPAK